MTYTKALLASLLVATCAAPVAAQQPSEFCASREKIVAELSDKYGETRQGYGLNGTGIIEVFVNTDTGTYTFLHSFPNGLSCIKAAGDAYQVESNVPKNDDQES